MKKTRYRWAILAVQFAIVAIVLAFVGKTAYDVWPRMAGLKWHLSPGLLVAAVLAGIATQVLLIAGWRLALRLVGADVPWAGAMTSQLLGQLAKYVPGKLLTLIGKGYLAARAGASESQAVLAMFVEAATQVTTSLAVGAAYIVIAAPSERRLLPVAGGVVVLSIAVLHPAVLPRAVGFALSLMGRTPVPLRYELRAVAPLALCDLAFWGVTGLGVWLLAKGLGLGVAIVPITAGYCLSWAAGFLSFIFPGGLGVREIAFARLLGASVDLGSAWSLALASRGWILLPELLGAAFVWVYRTTQKTQVAAQAPSPEAEGAREPPQKR